MVNMPLIKENVWKFAHQCRGVAVYPAIALGCTCPVLDNAFGREYLANGERFGWVYDENCTMHGRCE